MQTVPTDSTPDVLGHDWREVVSDLSGSLSHQWKESYRIGDSVSQLTCVFLSVTFRVSPFKSRTMHDVQHKR